MINNIDYVIIVYINSVSCQFVWTMAAERVNRKTSVTKREHRASVCVVSCVFKDMACCLL